MFHKITVAGWKKKSQIDRKILKESETLEDEIRHCFKLIDSSGDDLLTMQVRLVRCRLILTVDTLILSRMQKELPSF